MTVKVNEILRNTKVGDRATLPDCRVLIPQSFYGIRDGGACDRCVLRHECKYDTKAIRKCSPNTRPDGKGVFFLEAKS